MTGTTTVTGMVLSTMPIGDYDKRLTILTKEKGKITAFAKGSRRPNSHLLACSQPFTFGEFTMYAGRTSYQVVSSEVSNYFSELRSNASQVYYGIYFCEFVDYVTHEGSDEREILKLLYQSLRALHKKQIGEVLVRAVFELRLIYACGEGPQVFECVHCGSKQSLERFTVKGGGAVCKECLKIYQDTLKISDSALYTMQYVLSAELGRLYTFTVTNEVLQELKKILKLYCEVYIDHKMKSEELLNIL